MGKAMKTATEAILGNWNPLASVSVDGSFDTSKKPKRGEQTLLTDPGPSLSDEAIKNAKLQERRRQLGLQGRSGTFLTGPMGDTKTPTTAAPTLLSGK